MTKKNGKPCKRCGTSAWYDSGTCIECNRQHNRNWKQDNKDRHAAHSRKYKEKNGSVNYKRSPEKIREYHSRRRALKKNAEGNFTATEWKSLCKLYDYKCAKCGKKKKLTADHVIPLSLGGSNDIDNIQPLCQSCNSSKGATIADYRVRDGILRWIQRRLL